MKMKREDKSKGMYIVARVFFEKGVIFQKGVIFVKGVIFEKGGIFKKGILEVKRTVIIVSGRIPKVVALSVVQWWRRRQRYLDV